MAGIVGMAVFTQYWYWFPFTHFLSRSFTPTSVIGLDQDLEVPSFKFHSATRPSLFDYPPEQEKKAEDAPEKVKTAVLSTTAQAKRRAQKKEKLQKPDSMDIDQAPTTPKAGSSVDKMDTDESQVKANEDKDGEKQDMGKKDGDETKDAQPQAGGLRKRMEKEEVGYSLENMSRVLPAQLKFISFRGGRYTPVKKPTGGVIMLTDATPLEAKTLLEVKARRITKPAAAPESLQERISAAFGDGQGAIAAAAAARGPSSTAQRGEGGAAEAVGVLTAIDEDGEGGEEAEVPRDFDYHSDGDHQEDE